MKLAQRIVLSYYKNKLKALAAVSPRKAAEEAFKLLCTPYTKRRTYVPPPVFKKAGKLSFEFENYTINGFSWSAPKKRNGKKILICHGFDSYSYKFDQYVEPLLELGFEVTAFDAPAHGTSTGKTVNAHQYSKMLSKAIELYGSYDGFIAHSFGGLAVALALEKLEDNQHKRLVLIAPATETTRSIDIFFSYIPVSTRVRQQFDILITELGGNPASWFSVSRVIHQISTPTLWVHDKEDAVTPFEDMEHLISKNLPHLTFEVTTGLGHSKIYKDASIKKKIISFLSALTDN